MLTVVTGGLCQTTARDDALNCAPVTGRWVSQPEAMKLLGRSRSSIARWVKDKMLKVENTTGQPKVWIDDEVVRKFGRSGRAEEQPAEGIQSPTSRTMTTEPEPIIERLAKDVHRLTEQIVELRLEVERKAILAQTHEQVAERLLRTLESRAAV